MASSRRPKHQAPAETRRPAEIASDVMRALAECDEAIARSDRLQRVRALSDESFPAFPSLVEVAAAATLDPSYFSRFFRKHVGVSWSRWTHDLRLAFAIGLLRDTNRSITVVARESGFSESAFRRTCRETFGLAPHELRRRLRCPA